MASALLKLTDVQLGTSLTATNNFTLYQPAVPDGTVRWGVGNSGSVTDIITLTSSGNVGIGTNNPAFPLDVAGVIKATGGGNTIYLNPAFGGGVDPAVQSAANNLIFCTLNNERIRINSTGDVGIGTSTLRSRLTVAFADATGGGVTVVNTNTAANTTKYATVDYSGTDTVGTYKLAGYVRMLPADNNYVGSTLSFATRGSDAVAERMRIDSSGNVGIGTSSPTNNANQTSVSINATQVPRLDQYVGGVLKATVQFDTTPVLAVKTLSTDPIALFTNNTERMRIDSSGNVGIGAAPAGKLTVDGASIGNWSSSNFGRQLQIYGSGTNPSIGIWDATSANPWSITNLSGALTFNQMPALPSNSTTAPVERMRIDSSGRVMIGATSSSYKFTVSDGTTTFVSNPTSGIGYVGTASNHPVRFITNNTERVTIPESGGLCVNATGFPSGMASSGSTYTTNVFIPGVGFQCKAGVNGGYANVFNINWTGSPQLWIDTTNVGTFAFTSDYRVKKNVETQTAPALERVMQLRPVTYELADFGALFKADGVQREGFIAHEVQDVIPSGAEGEKDEEGRIQNLRVDAIVAVLTKAIQELKAELDAANARIEQLEAK